jgi:hypothetical protein
LQTVQRCCQAFFDFLLVWSVNKNQERLVFLKIS